MRLGDVEFDPATGELRRGETLVRLEPQPAAMLALLASHAGELVCHDKIRQTIWGDTTHVNFQQSLHYCVRQIRLALGDSSHRPRFVETIPRRGYRLIVPVKSTPSAIPPQVASQMALATNVRRRLVWAGLVAALTATTLIVEQRPNRHHEFAVSLLGTVHDLVF